MPERPDLLDINVWLALSTNEHAFHQPALEYWRRSAREPMSFCRVTMLGFVRLVGNPTVMGGQPLSGVEAWTAYSAWRRVEAVTFAQEPEGCDALLATWAMDGRLTPRLWTDAYLAAFAIQGRFRLVTFDRDFARFEGLEGLCLGR